MQTNLMLDGNLLENPNLASYLYVSKLVCPDWGTPICLDCPLGESVCDCDFEFHKCAVYWNCPCTLQAWLERKEYQHLPSMNS